MNVQETISKKRCLLITPLTFYTFHHTVLEGLERRGYDVEMLNEEYPANSLGKVLGKIALPLLRRLTLRGIQKRLDGREPYDLILIIKGRGLGPAALEYLRSKALRIVGYNFDSFLYNPSPLDWYNLTDRYATFDIKDAEDRDIPLVHLFSAANNSVNNVRDYDISIIQRVHSDRLEYADLLLRALPENTQFFIFLYESSPLTFILSFIRQPRLYMRLWSHISFKPLSYPDAMDVLGRSRITFDYAHPLQSGITVRCFEAQSLGVAVLTSNPSAVEDGIFEQGSIAYLTKNADAKTLRERVSALLQRQPESYSRSLDDFLNDLLADTSAHAALATTISGDTE